MPKAVLFKDIAKNVKDLLSKEYAYKYQAKITNAGDGAKLETNLTKKGDSITGDTKITTDYSDDVELQVTTDAGGKVKVQATIDGVAAGLKFVASANVPDLGSGEVEARYTAGATAANATVGLSGAPKVDVTVSQAVGDTVVGAEASFDTAAGAVTKYGCAASHSFGAAAVAIALADKADTVKVSYIQDWGKHQGAAEVVRKMSKGTTTLTVGGKYKLSGAATCYGKVDSTGAVAAVYKVDLKKGLTMGFACESSLSAPSKFSKVGVVCTIKA